MTVRLIVTILCLHFLAPLIAQSSMARSVMETINGKLSEVKQGYFDCSYRWKSALHTDTSAGSARVYFFKNDDTSDSICHFVIVKPGGLRVAYDGINQYFINDESKVISFRSVKERGVIKMLSGPNEWLAFRPYILKYQAFRPSKFKNALIDTFAVATGNALRITVLDSFVNDLKISGKDNSMGQSKEVFEISLADGTLFKKQEIVNFMASPQYLETSLSPVTSLPDSITFEKIFNLSLLQATGYELKAATSKPPTRTVTIGDTIPVFQLNNFDNQEISSAGITNGLVLLDFWFKSCAPCLMALPAIERLHQKYKSKGLEVLGINGTDKDPADIKSFLQAREITYCTLLDTGKMLAGKLHLFGYPTMILFEAKTRKVLYVQSGFSEDAEVRITELMEDWLKKNP